MFTIRLCSITSELFTLISLDKQTKLKVYICTLIVLAENCEHFTFEDHSLLMIHLLSLLTYFLMSRFLKDYLIILDKNKFREDKKVKTNFNGVTQI